MIISVLLAVIEIAVIVLIVRGFLNRQAESPGGKSSSLPCEHAVQY